MKKIISKQYIGLFIILAIILIGTFFRLYNISDQSLWMDEGFTIHRAEKLIETNELTGDFFDTTFAALGANIFGHTEFGFRFFPALFGIGVILISFLLSKKIFPKNKILPFFVITFIALSYWEIAWSRQARMYTMLQFFFLTSLYFYFSAFINQQTKLNKKIISNFLLFFLFSFFTILSHRWGLLLFPPAIIGVVLFTKNKKLQLIFSLLIGLLTIIFLFLNQNLIQNAWPLHPFLPYYSRFLFDWHFAILILTILGLTIGTAWAYKNKKYNDRNALCFLGILIISIFIELSLFGDFLNYRYLFPLFPLMVIVSGFLLELSFNKTPSKKGKFLFAILTLATFLFSEELTVTPQQKYYLERDLMRYDGFRIVTPQADFKWAHEEIKKLKKDDDIVISAYPEITNFYLGKTDYFLPFNLLKKKNWDEINDKIRSDFNMIENLADLDKIKKQNHGYIIFDSYAAEKMPDDFLSYIDTDDVEFIDSKKPKMVLIAEKWDDKIDAGIWIYKF